MDGTKSEYRSSRYLFKRCTSSGRILPLFRPVCNAIN